MTTDETVAGRREAVAHRALAGLGAALERVSTGARRRLARPAWAYAFALVSTGLTTALCAALSPFLSASDLMMVYILEIVLVATLVEVGPSAVGAALNAALFDFFFVMPRFSFVPSDSRSF